METIKLYDLIVCSQFTAFMIILLPTGGEEREVFGVGSIPVAILPSCQYMATIVL